MAAPPLPAPGLRLLATANGTAGNATAGGDLPVPGGLTWWQAALVGLALGILAYSFARRIRGIVPPDNPQKELTLREHLEELQHRLVTVIVAWTFLALLFFSFGPGTARVGGREIPILVPSVQESVAALTLDHLRAHFVPGGVDLVVLGPVDAILALLTVTVFLAILVSAPLAAYEAAAFLAPGLTEAERRYAVQVAPFVTVLFLAGAAFAYLVMVPLTMKVLYGYAGSVGADELLQIDELVNFVILLHLLFGLTFQLPVVMAGLTELGLVEPEVYTSYWRHAVVAIVFVGALVSDPSPITQVIVAGPVILLYGLGILAARWRAGDRDRAEPA